MVENSLRFYITQWQLLRGRLVRVECQFIFRNKIIRREIFKNKALNKCMAKTWTDSSLYRSCNNQYTRFSNGSYILTPYMRILV